MNFARLFGFILGVGVGILIIFVFLRRRATTDGSGKTEYDERQNITRGIAYKYGYYTLLIYMCVLVMLDIAEITIPASMTVIAFTGVVISGLVLSGYAIMNDAYWGMNNNVSVYTRILLAVGAINLILGIIEFIRGHMIIDGVLQNSVINFEAGILIFGIGIMLMIKKIRDRNEESEI